MADPVSVPQADDARDRLKARLQHVLDSHGIDSTVFDTYSDVMFDAVLEDLVAESDALIAGYNEQAELASLRQTLLDQAEQRIKTLEGSGRGSFWTQVEWCDWSDELAELLPERYDGDEAQEWLIGQFIRDAVKAEADLAALRTALKAVEWRCAEVGNVREYGERGTPFYNGATQLARRIRGAISNAVPAVLAAGFNAGEETT